MKLLELFSGNGDISKAFVGGGHEIYRVDWSDTLEAELHADISTLTAQDIIALCDGVPDVIWASPDCTTYSIATCKHRTKADGLIPKTEYAKKCDDVNIHMWELIDQLIALGTKYYFVENPRGRYRLMPFVENRPRYTISYCKYGKMGNAKGYEHTYIMKNTDIWTNHPNPNFLPTCTTNNPPHEHGKWEYALKRDYLSRGEMPKLLCEHIVEICN